MEKGKPFQRDTGDGVLCVLPKTKKQLISPRLAWAALAARSGAEFSKEIKSEKETSVLAETLVSYIIAK